MMDTPNGDYKCEHSMQDHYIVDGDLRCRECDEAEARADAVPFVLNLKHNAVEELRFVGLCGSAEVVEAVRAWQRLSQLAAEAAVSSMLRGHTDEHSTGHGWIVLDRLRTATLRTETEVRAEERERCAKVCDALADKYGDMPCCGDERSACVELADAIRALGGEGEVE